MVAGGPQRGHARAGPRPRRLDEARHAGHADILREQLDGRVGLRSEGNNLPEWDEGGWRAYVERLTRIADQHA